MKITQVTIMINEKLLAKMHKIAPRKSMTFDELWRSYMALGIDNDALYLEDDCDWCDITINRHREMRNDT